MAETDPQRDHALRKFLNTLRYVIRYRIARRAMPNDFPLWESDQGAKGGASAIAALAGGRMFRDAAQDLRALLRMAVDRPEEPSAAIIDSRTLRSTPKSGTRAGYGGARRERGFKMHMAVDTLGYLLALHVTPADVGDRAAVGRLAADIQDATGDSVSLADVD